MTEYVIFDSSFMVIGLMVFLMVVMLYLYSKKRVWVAVFIIFLISIPIGVMALDYSDDVPFSPVIQIGFILFQLALFVITTFQASTLKRRRYGK